MTEIWKDIPGYETLYAASNYGRVKSYEKTIVMPNGGIRTTAEMILNPFNNKGYLRLGLNTHGKRKNFFVHRLVAMAFIPNPKNLPEINHKNGIKTDCRVENLEWSTGDDNSNHAFENGLHPSPKRPVIAIVPDGSKEYEFQSIREAERKTGIQNSNIVKCCKGLDKTAGGFIWKYKNNNI